jgi:Tfp pilus assembly protein PilP
MMNNARRVIVVVAVVILMLGASWGASAAARGQGVQTAAHSAGLQEAGAATDALQEAAQQEEGESTADDDENVFDTSDLPVVNVVTTDEQEAALRLVEAILEEQQLLLSGQNFVYQAGGRRDPFRSLLALGQREIAAPELRPRGLAGFLINELDLRAIASFQGRWQAMVEGADRRTYFIEVGAQLYDGRVVEISGDEIVFEQDVEDLLGARSTRRITKRMTTTGNQE